MEDGDDIPDIFRKDCDSPTGKKGVGDKRCMLVGVVVLVFIMCGAVIAIFMHRFTGKGRGGGGEEEGRKGLGRGWDKRCMLVGVVVLVFIMCGAVVAIFMHRFTGKGGGTEGVGRVGKEGGGEGGVGRQAVHACGSCGSSVHHVWSRGRYLHAPIHR